MSYQLILQPPLNLLFLLFLWAAALVFFIVSYRIYKNRHSGVTFVHRGPGRTSIVWKKQEKKGTVIEYPKTVIYSCLFLFVGIVFSILPFIELKSI